MKRIVCVVLCGLALAVNLARAADSEEPRKIEAERDFSSGWGGYGLYVGMFKFADLNTSLKALAPDFDPFSDIHYMHGGGGMGQIGHVTIAGYGFGGEQKVGSKQLNTLLRAHYGGGVFEAGWLPVSTRYFRLGPALAIGGAGFSLAAEPLADVPIGFDSTLFANGVRKWTMSGGSFLLAPTLNIIIPVSWVGIILKAGYLWTPMDKDWSFDDGPSVSPAPNLRSSGPFASIQLTLGSTGGDSKKTKIKVKTEGKSEDENQDKNKDNNDEEDQQE
jgi:hypothetical protein